VLADAPSVTRGAPCVAAGCEITELLVIAKETVKADIGRVLAVLDVRGSRVSRWSVMEAVLVLAVTLFIGVPYCIGATHARIQAVYGLACQVTAGQQCRRSRRDCASRAQFADHGWGERWMNRIAEPSSSG
jgi:hypothetical protein